MVVGSRLKTLDVGIQLLHNEFEVQTIEHESSTGKCLVDYHVLFSMNLRFSNLTSLLLVRRFKMEIKWGGVGGGEGLQFFGIPSFDLILHYMVRGEVIKRR